MALTLVTMLVSSRASAQVMIFAPHPDDEALATSGVIYQARQAGKTVKVVVATNGDCESPTIGHVREQETVAAMGLLGLAPSDVIFLGYPDCGLRELYYYYTTPSSQFTSAAGFNRTYAYEGLGNTDFHTYMFGTSAPYSGYSVLQDLTALLKYFKPQDLYVTSVYDDNIDHFALNYLVSEAVVPLMLADSSFQPTMHDTLVHEPCELCNPAYQWPMPSFTPTQAFPIPPFLGTTPLLWGDVESLPMTGAMLNTTPATNLKSLVISQYASQQGSAPWPQSFVKNNEIAWKWDLWANRALRAVGSASSNVTPGTAPDRLNDGVVVGFPRVFLTRGGRGEWVSNNQLAGAWAQLTWTTAQALTRVVLHDRPDTAENITGGTLTFSDGSSLTVGALPTSGGGLTVTFPQKNVTWVRFTATGAVGTAAGLSEFEAYGPAVAKSAWQAPGANIQPTITNGPTATPASITDVATSALTVTGADANGDVLTYTWAASAGTINGTGASVTFVPPVVTGPTSVRIDVWVSDGRFGIASGFVNVTVSPSGQPVNISGQAIATASSENDSHGQLAAKAIDGLVDGYPTNAQAEWATQGQLAGAWIQLTWSTPRLIGRSILHDRINNIDQIRGGLLRFSDGTTVTIGALPNDGAGLITDFPARTVSWIRLEVSSAVGGSAGLAEWEVFSAQQSGNNVAPQITAGPTATPATISDVQTSALSVTATDSNGDPLTYTWQPASGSITGSGASVSFTPPVVSVQTVVRIDVVVTDGHGGAASGFVNVTVNPSSTNLNLGPFAVATASSENDGRGQGAIKAIDGFVDGYPTNATREWATVGQLAGAWIQLTWSTPQAVSKAILHDRINTSDQVLSGQLRFSDGSIVPFGALPNDGAGLTLDFATRSITWVRFEVISARGDNTGLAEFEIFAPSGVPNVPPTIASGPTANPSTITDIQTSAVTVVATDGDGDPLTYTWQTTGGTITGSGAAVTFTPPRIVTATTYRITVTVTDGRGGSATRFVDVVVTPSSTVVNLAPLAAITASAENSGRGQDAIKAADGLVDGYPTNPQAEWAAPGQLAGAWIQFTWSSAQNVTRVILHDRINSEDWILGATLTFSDGSSVPVASLPNNGAGSQIDFASKSVTWMRLTVTSARGSNIGLAEAEIY